MINKNELEVQPAILKYEFENILNFNYKRENVSVKPYKSTIRFTLIGNITPKLITEANKYFDNIAHFTWDELLGIENLFVYWDSDLDVWTMEDKIIIFAYDNNLNYELSDVISR